ncbi:MAG: LLM class flavin-dependent oxidoreductase [Nakamurella sp.]
MTDYGLELQLGLFATPDASRPAANVANLPLRPPVVLARSVAILDLLSAGRAELGLGAGAFTDAIVAAGGERRSPKEAVDALIEGIDVIRQTWGVVGNRSVTVGGKHYQVKGLPAGPAPAHDIEIWLGAYKPRMLRVTARLADGWLPSMGYLELSELPAMNAAIDEAAIAAGRHPSDIRRMLNISGRFGGSADLLQGTTADWAEQLAELALREGISCYLLGTDDPSDVVLFADEVAPALRELVAAERERAAARTPSSAVDSAVTSAVVSQPTVSQPTVGRPTAGQQAGSSVVAPTPDDGERLTGELDWHEELRPVADGAGSTD